MIKELFPHQKAAENFLLPRRRALLFWEVGIGKSNAVINAVNQLPKGRLLIAAPASVINGMWKKYDDLPINHTVMFVTYEYIARHKEFARLNKFDYCIFDEVHRLKSHKSNVGKIIKKVTKECQYAWGMTGTPYATSFMDVHGIFANMNINEFTPYYDRFMHDIYNCEIAAIVGQKIIYKPVSLKPGMLDWLVNKISKHAHVLRAKDCVKLPELSMIEVECSGMRTQQYIDACKGIINYTVAKIDEEPEKATVNKLAAVQKMHQISNGFVYDDTPDKTPIVFKKNSKIPEIKQIIEMELESRDKIIVCYYYKYDFECLKEMLDRAKITWTDSMDAFGSNQVLLLQQSKAIGTNLQAFTSCMIFYTYDYAYLKFEQARGRIYRVGQQEPCKIYVMINKGTSERKIWTAVTKNMDIDTLFKELMVNIEY